MTYIIEIQHAELRENERTRAGSEHTMSDVGVRIRRRPVVAAVLTGAATLLLCALALVPPAAAAPTQGTTTTTPAAPSSTAPAVLPTTTNAPLPHSGSNSAELAGLAVSVILIGWGACSFSRGLRLARVRA